VVVAVVGSRAAAVVVVSYNNNRPSQVEIPTRYLSQLVAEVLT
jgi:hypothetical protein